MRTNRHKGYCYYYTGNTLYRELKRTGDVYWAFILQCQGKLEIVSFLTFVWSPWGKLHKKNNKLTKSGKNLDRVRFRCSIVLIAALKIRTMESPHKYSKKNVCVCLVKPANVSFLCQTLMIGFVFSVKFFFHILGWVMGLMWVSLQRRFNPLTPPSPGPLSSTQMSIKNDCVSPVT